MTLVLPRRRFLSLLGLGAAAAGVEVVSEPIRRYWQVPRSAPVGEKLPTMSQSPAFAPRARVEGPRGIYKFNVARDAYEGGMVALLDDGTVQACRYGESPIGVVQSVEPDGTAWVHLGEPGAVSVDVERERGRKTLGTIRFDASDYARGYVEVPACDRESIVIVESIDHERGIATVRLGGPIAGYIGTGTA